MNDTHFRNALTSLGFAANDAGTVFTKQFPDRTGDLIGTCEMRADFAKRQLVYPEAQGLTVNEHQTCNFSAPENFVVFECVHRLLENGYRPAHIELEHHVEVGHGASGGRLDIWIKDNDGRSLLIIECKTAGKEFDDAWKATQEDGDQLWNAGSSPAYCKPTRSGNATRREAAKRGKANNPRLAKVAGASCSRRPETGTEIIHDYRLISPQDNAEFPKILPKDAPSFAKAATVKDRFRAWKETYQQDFTTRGLFESDIASYTIGKTKSSTADLKTAKNMRASRPRSMGKYHEFATILRQHNVARHPPANCAAPTRRALWNAGDPPARWMRRSIRSRRNDRPCFLSHWKYEMTSRISPSAMSFIETVTKNAAFDISQTARTNLPAPLQFTEIQTKGNKQ
ncbi:hypothetical protein AGMMS49959_18280 [Planctomycetales bacterium]|nr:hypothetical protein AGMMS49959_18280 [Planctomycetales bacterium]